VRQGAVSIDGRRCPGEPPQMRRVAWDPPPRFTSRIPKAPEKAVNPIERIRSLDQVLAGG
jgi:hypothetical protein